MTRNLSDVNRPNPFTPFVEAVRAGKVDGFFVHHENQQVFKECVAFDVDQFSQYRTKRGDLYMARQAHRHYGYENARDFSQELLDKRVTAGTPGGIVTLGEERFMPSKGGKVLNIIDDRLPVYPVFHVFENERTEVIDFLKDIDPGAEVIEVGILEPLRLALRKMPSVKEIYLKSTPSERSIIGGVILAIILSLVGAVCPMISLYLQFSRTAHPSAGLLLLLRLGRHLTPIAMATGFILLMVLANRRNDNNGTAAPRA